MKTIQRIVVVVLVVILVAGIFSLPYTFNHLIKQTTDQALDPLRQANQKMETQVSELTHPTPTIIPDPVTIIQEVRTLARLETIQYTVEKVITAEMGQGSFAFLFGDRLLFVAHGIVIAGVDLSKMTSSDLWLDGNTLYVRMPVTEVFVATLDNDKSYVFDRKTGLLPSGNETLETQARQAAEKEILNAALEDGILKLARLNAENYLTRLFKTLGYNEVLFVEATPVP